MILNNAKMALTGDPVNIMIGDGKIIQISSTPLRYKIGHIHLTFDNAIIFPGLINSHDHLDFNLFPALGNKTYNNYTEWGRHIHTSYKDRIAEVLEVPETLRTDWGIYKNLLCGITTVVNHGRKLKKHIDLINVYQRSHSLHSVQFEKKWKIKLNNPLKKNLPVVIHVGEGSDKSSFNEIDELINWNLLKRDLIGVHGVALSANQAKAFKALIWCPQSNYFLLNQTAPVNCLKNHTKLLFGTDSTLTSNWNIWEHIRQARNTKFLTDEELYDTFTINPACAWNLNSGKIAEGKDADLVIAKMNGNKFSFFATDPKDILMVLHKGNILLFDEKLSTQLKGFKQENYSRININGACKYVQGDLPELMQKIRKYYPDAAFPVIQCSKDF
jgi:cytosine/adenosine deaminase-related metal-dependent hydrolase